MFRFLTAGESHGQGLTAIIEGLPAGLKVNHEAINAELARRQLGYGRGGRMAIEQDKVRVLSGLRFGETIGSPVTLFIGNKDWEHWQEDMNPFGEVKSDKNVHAARPGHADLTGVLKYGRKDIRDILERASARETATRVAVGAMAKQILACFGIKIISHVLQIGTIKVDDYPLSYEGIQIAKKDSELGCCDPKAEIKMKDAINEAKANGDTVGGVIEMVAFGLIPGIGSHVHWDRRLDARLAGAVMSIPAIKGVEFGDGFKLAEVKGSQAHDSIYCNDEVGIYHNTNHAGGLEGGMSNGEPIVVRAVMKPIPTLMQPLASVDIKTHKSTFASTERSDVCAVPAAAVVGEAMVAIILAQMLLEKFSADCMDDIQAAVAHYLHRIRW